MYIFSDSSSLYWSQLRSFLLNHRSLSDAAAFFFIVNTTMTILFTPSSSSRVTLHVFTYKNKSINEAFDVQVFLGSQISLLRAQQRRIAPVTLPIGKNVIIPRWRTYIILLLKLLTILLLFLMLRRFLPSRLFFHNNIQYQFPFGWLQRNDGK